MTVQHPSDQRPTYTRSRGIGPTDPEGLGAFLAWRRERDAAADPEAEDWGSEDDIIVEVAQAGVFGSLVELIDYVNHLAVRLMELEDETHGRGLCKECRELGPPGSQKRAMMIIGQGRG